MEETATPGSYDLLAMSPLQQSWKVKRKGQNELALTPQLALQSQLVAIGEGRHTLVCGLTSAPTVRQNRPPAAASWSPGAALQQGGGRGGAWGYSLPVTMEQSVCEPNLEVDSEVQPSAVAMQETCGH